MSFALHPGPLVYRSPIESLRNLDALGALRTDLAAVHDDGETAACRLLAERGCFGGRDVADFGRTLAEVRDVSRLSPTLGHWVHQARAGAARFVLAARDTELRDEILTRVDRGEARVGVAISETDAGSSMVAMSASATRTGATWRVVGEKRWIYRCDFVTHLIVLARDEEEGTSRAFVVGVDDPGVTLAPAGRFLSGEPYGTLKVDAAIDDGARVEIGSGEFFSTYALERMGGSAKLSGYCEAALDLTIHYLRERSQGGRRLAERQALRLALAEAAERTAAVRALVDEAARVFASGGADGDVLSAATIAKVVASEAAVAVANVAVQVHGAAGCDDEHFAGVLWRMARGYEIAGGTSEVLRDRLALRLLERPQPAAAS